MILVVTLLLSANGIMLAHHECTGVTYAQGARGLWPTAAAVARQATPHRAHYGLHAGGVRRGQASS